MTRIQNYRPSTYFWAVDKHIRLSSDIPGATRRDIYERAVAQGDQATAREMLEHAELTSQERRAWGGGHPWMMGGEYLPRRRSGEVEIARINIASTTCDVTAVYARRGKHRIHYRVVDEYEGSTLETPYQRTSVRPLTLQQLVDFFLGAWNLLDCLDVNFRDDAYPRNRVKAFVLGASSNFYADFGEMVDTRVDDWLDARHAELDLDDPEEED